MSQQPKAPLGGQRNVQLEIPKDLDGTYVNMAVITHSASEIVIDFARVLPNVLQSKVKARIIMTPMNAKLLHRALGENLSKFEGQFGEIKLPPGASLADQLFRPQKPADEDGE